MKASTNVCTAIVPSATNEVGHSHTFTVHVEQDDGQTAAQGGDGVTGFAPVAGAHPTVTLTPSGGAVLAPGTVDTCAGAGTLANGNCTVTFTSNHAGEVTGHASVTLTINGAVGSAQVTRSTNGVAPNSGDAVKTFVDALITIVPSATNEVGHLHTFTVHVEQDDGQTAAQGGDGVTGFAPVAGAHPTVTLTPSGGAVVAPGTVDTCAGAGTLANGNCTVTFTSNHAGEVTGHASVTLTINGAVGSAQVTRQTDGNAPNSGDAVKTFVDAFITIVPSATNEVGHSHTFTVHVEQDDGQTAAQGGDGVTGFAPVAGAHPTVTLTATNGAVVTGK